jgi:hypothetical protein
MTLLVKEPESKLPVAPTKPIGIDHKYPVGTGAVAVAAGNSGAVYLYILALHTFVRTEVMETLAGIGVVSNELVSLADLLAL